MDGKEINLLSFEKEGRPLVINFGSFSWGPFKNDFPSFMELVSKWGRHVDFLTVYIEEAHPNDEWHLDNSIDYRQP